jgi:hypothetical protein
MEALQGHNLQEDNPTMVFMTTYLLALDEQHDRQALELRKCIHRAKEVELITRKLHVQHAKAQAQAATAESRETAIAKALKEAEDHHAQQLKDAYLFTIPKRRMFAMDGQEPMILEGVPIYPLEKRRMDVAVLPAPPPTEALDIEPLLPFTQPPPREETGLYPSSVGGPQVHKNEPLPSGEVE